MITEDALEAAFWAFDEERQRTGAERDAFTQTVRGLLRDHLTPLLALLDETDRYVTAAVTGFDPPGGQDRARHAQRAILAALDMYRRGGGRLVPPPRGEEGEG